VPFVVDEGLLKYIKERLGEGYKEEHIRQVLLEHGHTPKDVDEAFKHLHQLGGSKALVMLLVLLLAAVAVIVFLLLRPGAEQPQRNPDGNVTVPRPEPASSGVLAIASALKENLTGKRSDEVYYETLNAAVGNARSVGDGILLCSINQEMMYKNYCLTELAGERKEAAFCDIIGDVSQRDSCYLQLVIAGEDQYCSELLLEESKRTCDILLRRV
jgi:hypothetical protein